jgi:hypothetical protein
MADTWTGIVAAAGRALVTKVTGQLEPQRYAHDRAMRIVRTIDHLVQAMPASDRPKRVDLVRIAALYSCVGLDQAAVRAHGAAVGQQALDEAAELAADQLQALLGPADIDLTIKILHDHRIRTPDLPEACLLADAVALEEVGLVGLWNQTRVCHQAGRTLDHLVKLWRTQKEYGYWDSRLRDGFHFEVARQAAAQRLARLEPIYEAMMREHLAEDIA